MLVTGSEHTGGLAAIRGLRAAGFEPWAAVNAPDAYGALSRAVRGVISVCDARVDAAGFAGELARACARIGARVVLPGTEPALLALGRHRALFPRDVAVGAPPATVSLAATDKGALLGLALAAGLSVPPTRFVTATEADACARDLAFPAVVKPPRSELWHAGRLRRFEARRVERPSELAAALASLPDEAGLVQPYISGRLRTVSGVAWHGDVVVAIHKQAERTWPLDCGIVSYAKTVPAAPELERGTRSLIAEIGWSGLFNLQLIESDGCLYTIDLNPRLYHSLSLAIGAGVNLPAIWVSLLLGRRPQVRDYGTGVRFRSEEDLQALRRLFRDGHRMSALKGVVPRRGTVHAVFSVSDPKPMLGALRRACRTLRSSARGQRQSLGSAEGPDR